MPKLPAGVSFHFSPASFGCRSRTRLRRPREPRPRGMTPHRDLLVLDLAEDRLDFVQLRAVRRQEVQVDPRRRQTRPRPPHDPAGVQAGVVQDHHPRHLRPWQRPHECQEIVRVPRPLRGEDIQPRPPAVGAVGGHRVDPPPLRGLGLDPLPLPRQRPGVGRRERRREPALVEVVELDPAGPGLVLQVEQHPLGPRDPGRVLLVPQPAGGPAPARPEQPEVAADLARAQRDPAGDERLAELAAGPGAVVAEQGRAAPGHLAASGVVEWRPGAAGEQRGDAAAEEVLEHGAGGVPAVAEVVGDPRRRPPGVGEADHLQAVPRPGR